MENENILQNFEQNPSIASVTGESIPQAEKPVEKTPLFKAVLAWCTLGLGFVFTHFAVNYVGGLWGGIFWLLFGVIGAVFAVKSKAKVTKFHIVMFAVAEVFCFVPLFSASKFINFLAAVFSFALYFYLGTALSGAEPFGKRFVGDMFLSVLVRPFERFVDCITSAFSVFKGKRNFKNVLYALVGLLIAIPLGIVVLALLASSDAAFEGVVNNMISYIPEFSFAIIFEILFAIPVAMYLFGAVSSSARPRNGEGFDTAKLKVMPPVISYFAVSPICLFYVAYIITQTVNIANAVNQTLDYSEFARRGFFELCAIAVINLGVIAVMGTFSRSTKGIKAFSVILSVLSLGVIATAITKMGMYIAEYGMTLMRVYTSWFMLVMALIFVLIIVFQFKEYKFWKALFVGFTAMFFVLCFGNVDGTIARYNISAYESGQIEKLDVYAFDELGLSAVAPLEKFIESGKAEDYKFAIGWYLGGVEDNFDRNDKFAYFSIPRANAGASLERIPDEYKQRLNYIE